MALGLTTGVFDVRIPFDARKRVYPIVTTSSLNFTLSPNGDWFESTSTPSTRNALEGILTTGKRSWKKSRAPAVDEKSKDDENSQSDSDVV